MCGFCVVFQSVSSPVAFTKLASAARGSMAVGISRCWMMRSLTVTSALGEGGVDVAAGDGPVERLIARHVGVQLRRAVGRGLLRIDDGWQRLVVDVDQIERVLRLIAVLGDDDGDAVADVADDVGGDGLVGCDLEIGIRAAATRTASA